MKTFTRLSALDDVVRLGGMKRFRVDEAGSEPCGGEKSQENYWI